jgi:hypothetical protein
MAAVQGRTRGVGYAVTLLVFAREGVYYVSLWPEHTESTGKR